MMESVVATMIKELDREVIAFFMAQFLRTVLQNRAGQFVSLSFLEELLSPLEVRFGILKPVCVS